MEGSEKSFYEVPQEYTDSVVTSNTTRDLSGKYVTPFQKHKEANKLSSQTKYRGVPRESESCYLMLIIKSVFQAKEIFVVQILSHLRVLLKL